jgi:hypothetical protein
MSERNVSDDLQRAMDGGSLSEEGFLALVAEVRRLRSHVERAKMQRRWLRDFLHNEAQTAPLHVLAWDGTGDRDAFQEWPSLDAAKEELAEGGISHVGVFVPLFEDCEAGIRECHDVELALDSDVCGILVTGDPAYEAIAYREASAALDAEIAALKGVHP